MRWIFENCLLHKQWVLSWFNTIYKFELYKTTLHQSGKLGRERGNKEWTSLSRLIFHATQDLEICILNNSHTFTDSIQFIYTLLNPICNWQWTASPQLNNFNFAIFKFLYQNPILEGFGKETWKWQNWNWKDTSITWINRQ